MKNAGVGILPVSILRSVSTEMPAAAATAPRLAVSASSAQDGAKAPSAVDFPRASAGLEPCPYDNTGMIILAQAR